MRVELEERPTDSRVGGWHRCHVVTAAADGGLPPRTVGWTYQREPDGPWAWSMFADPEWKLVGARLMGDGYASRDAAVADLSAAYVEAVRAQVVEAVEETRSA